MTVTKAEVAAALQAIAAVAGLLKSLGTVPSGHLYAQLCGTLSLDAYNRIIATLKGAGLVSVANHELTWTGPKD